MIFGCFSENLGEFIDSQHDHYRGSIPFFWIVLSETQKIIPRQNRAQLGEIAISTSKRITTIYFYKYF